MNYNDSPPSLKARAAHLALALSSAAAVLTLGVSAVTAMPASAAGMASDVAQALKLRLPKTPIDAISCDTLGPWCEVVSGDTLFYIDETARYLFVGRLYDMEERRAVTAARLLELNPDLLVRVLPAPDRRTRQGQGSCRRATDLDLRRGKPQDFRGGAVR